LLSAGIIFAGVIAFYLRYGNSASGVKSDLSFPHTVPTVIAGIAHGDPLTIIAVGLLLLLATPFVRVLVSIVAFAVERDWVFAGITTLVLLILVVSFLLGKVGA
jgi:uncharacterized membrane protein